MQLNPRPKFDIVTHHIDRETGNVITHPLQLKLGDGVHGPYYQEIDTSLPQIADPYFAFKIRDVIGAAQYFQLTDSIDSSRTSSQLKLTLRASSF